MLHSDVIGLPTVHSLANQPLGSGRLRRERPLARVALPEYGLLPRAGARCRLVGSRSKKGIGKSPLKQANSLVASVAEGLRAIVGGPSTTGSRALALRS